MTEPGIWCMYSKINNIGRDMFSSIPDFGFFSCKSFFFQSKSISLVRTSSKSETKDEDENNAIR